MTDPSSGGLSAQIAKLSPFKTKSKSKTVEDDDKGAATDSTTIAGGGHGARESSLTKHELRISQSLCSFISRNNIVGDADANADAGLASESDGLSAPLQNLLSKPHIQVPASVTDRSHPLPEYFISSSHNTYLMKHQLYGTSSAASYETVLKNGCRCIEVDAWDNDDDVAEPKITHGFTFVSYITFRAACEAIRDCVDKEAKEAVNEQGYRAAPILVSLENHCGAEGQRRLVQIMREVWGERLLSRAVRQKGHEEQETLDAHVSLDELGSKIVVIVEYHMPDEADDSSTDDDDGSSSEDEDAKQARKKYKEQKKATPAQTIVPELADLGVYSQSVKPPNDSWFESTEAFQNSPHHHLINISESGLSAKMPAAKDKIARHNSKHLMRVFPKGTRISSQNLQPVPFWGVGAQICALNWQTFGESMQLNEALFSGTDGFVLKPLALRSGAGQPAANVGNKKLRLRIAGASDVPITRKKGEDVEDEIGKLKPYVTCSLVHPDDLAEEATKRKTAAYKQHGQPSNLLHKNQEPPPPPTDPIWDETLEWTFKDNELVFLRISIKNDVSFAQNPTLAVTTIRVLYAVPGWNFIRMLDLNGRETKCSLLVNVDIGDV